MRTLRTSCSALFLYLLYFANFAWSATLTNSIDYYPDDFYQRVENGERDAQLKSDLFAVLSSAHQTNPGSHDRLVKSCGGTSCVKHVSLGYTRARKILFGRLHLLETAPGIYEIRDVYCQQVVSSRTVKNQPPAPDQIPDPAILNAEHTWPQSRFSKKFDQGLQKSDLHILFPAASKANSSRSNDEFGDVVTKLSSPCALSKRGYTSAGDGRIVFEVPEEHKGNVARAIFYFAVRYKMPVGAEQEESLKAWHRMDPVDDAERERNAEIFSNQGDRNPFIDHPELVELISDF
jgi:endonuclease I